MQYGRIVSLRAVFLIFTLLVSASAISHQSGLDHWLANSFYRIEGGHGDGFPWKNNYWLFNVTHEDGGALVKYLFIATFGLLIGSYYFGGLKPFQTALLYIVLSTFIAASSVSFLKHHTTLQCPNSLIEYGGRNHWVNIWQLFGKKLPLGKCFPAGHASGGYAWICLGFLFPFGSKQFYWAILPGLALGLCFGFAQQLRGAHFISHDLLTIAMCWLTSALLYKVFYALNSKDSKMIQAAI